MLQKRHLKKTKPAVLIKEARYILKKKLSKLAPEIRNEIEQSITNLEEQAGKDDVEGLEHSKENLYELLQKHAPRTIGDVFKDLFKALITAIVIALIFRQFIMEPFEIPTGSMVPTLKVHDKILVAKFTYGLNLPFINVKVFDFRKPQRWEVVVFTTRNIKDASGPERNFVKRVVGLPGETITIKEGNIYKYEKLPDGSESETLVPKPDYLKIHEPAFCYYLNVEEGKTSDIELFDTKKLLGIIPVSVSNGERRMVSWKYGFRGQKIVIPPGHYFVLGDNNRDSFDSRGWGFVPFENIRGKVICKWKFIPPWGDGFVR